MQEPLYYDNTTGQLIVAVKDGNGYTLQKIQTTDNSHLTVSNLQLGQVTVVDSSKSGTGRDGSRDIYNPIIKPILDTFNVKHHYIHTDSESAVEETASGLSSGNHTIILISGDTSVNEFVNALPQKADGNITFVIVPFGTGNSLSLSLGIENELQAIRNLIHGTAHPLLVYDVDLPPDTWLIREGAKVKRLPEAMKFIVVFSWGFHASLVADSDTVELRKYGIDRFKMAAMNNLQKAQKYEGTTTITTSSNDDVGHNQQTVEQIEGPFAYWLVTPARKFEPTFEISPKGNIHEQSLYFVGFNTSTKDGYIMDIMTQVYNKGAHVNNPDVIYRDIKPKQAVSLTFNNLALQNRRFCLDGSIILLPQSGEITIKCSTQTPTRWNLTVLT